MGIPRGCRSPGPARSSAEVPYWGMGSGGWAKRLRSEKRERTLLEKLRPRLQKRGQEEGVQPRNPPEKPGRRLPTSHGGRATIPGCRCADRASSLRTPLFANQLFHRQGFTRPLLLPSPRQVERTGVCPAFG